MLDPLKRRQTQPVKRKWSASSLVPLYRSRCRYIQREIRSEKKSVLKYYATFWRELWVVGPETKEKMVLLLPLGKTYPEKRMEFWEGSKFRFFYSICQIRKCKLEDNFAKKVQMVQKFGNKYCLKKNKSRFPHPNQYSNQKSIITHFLEKS